MSLLSSLLSPVYKPKDNLTATTNPTVNDDITLGYQTGSQWFNQSTSEMFVCISNTDGAAVWEQTSLTIDDLGSMAVQEANAVAITGGTINGTIIGGTNKAAGGFTDITATGDQTFTGTAKRIKGDLSNATRANRLSFQSSTTNGNTLVQAIPNGTGTVSGFLAYGASDPDNASYFQAHADNGLHVGLNSAKMGTGTTKDLVLQIDGVTKAQVNASDGKFTVTSLISTAGANTVKEYSANSGSAITIDPENGECQYITLNAATPVITFASAPSAGTSKKIKLTLIQDGTGGRLPTFANCTFLATGSSTATAINSAISSLTYFEADAINGAWVIASANQNLGVTNGSVSAAGYIGEVISSTLAIGSATSLTTATAKTVTSINLTPGRWMLWGNIGFIAAGTPTILEGSISTTNNTQATSPNGGAYFREQGTFAAGSTNIVPTGGTELNITSNTTVYLVATGTFSSTCTAYGFLGARRYA